MTEFEFAFDPRFRWLLALVGVRPDSARVFLTPRPAGGPVRPVGVRHPGRQRVGGRGQWSVPLVHRDRGAPVDGRPRPHLREHPGRRGVHPVPRAGHRARALRAGEAPRAHGHRRRPRGIRRRAARASPASERLAHRAYHDRHGGRERARGPGPGPDPRRDGAGAGAAPARARETDLGRAPTVVRSRRSATELRTIPSWRNAWSVVSVWLQAVLVVGLAVWWGNPVGYVLAFLLMGRTQAQLAALMHESAHRLLFATPTGSTTSSVGGSSATRRSRRPTRTGASTWRTTVRSSGPTSPTSRCTPATRSAPASFRRKLVRDATGRTGVPACSASSPPASARRTPRAAARCGRSWRCRPCCSPPRSWAAYWWVYPVFWLLPYLTVWRVINRLRSIAEHGGMDASPDRRATTHTVPPVVVVPHLPRPVPHRLAPGPPRRRRRLDAPPAPVPPRAPRRRVRHAALEYTGYRALWRALRAGTPRFRSSRVRKVRAVERWFQNTRGLVIVILAVATCALLLAVEPGDGFPTGVGVSSDGGDGGGSATGTTGTTAPGSTTTTLPAADAGGGVDRHRERHRPPAAAERARLRRRHPGRQLRAGHRGAGHQVPDRTRRSPRPTAW